MLPDSTQTLTWGFLGHCSIELFETLHACNLYRALYTHSNFDYLDQRDRGVGICKTASCSFSVYSFPTNFKVFIIVKHMNTITPTLVFMTSAYINKGDY